MHEIHDDLDTDDDGDVFGFALGFAGTPCPECGTVAEPGPCPKCGTAVPAPDAPNEATLARRETLLGLREEAEEILGGFGDLPESRIPIAPAMLISALVEADIFDKVVDVIAFGPQMGHMDLDEPEVIRGPLRDAAEHALGVMRATLALCRELSLFHAPAPAERIPQIVAEFGAQGARVLVGCLAALTAVDSHAAQEAQGAIQAELSGVRHTEELHALLEELRNMRSGTDERVRVALAREGQFTDAYGAIDIGRVLWAFRGSADPFIALGRRAAQYFSPLLSVDLDADGNEDDGRDALILALPLLQIIGLDHPLLAHRQTRDTYELLRAAATRDREAVDRLRAELVHHAGELLAARERSRAAALELGAPAGSPEDDLLERLLALYREVVDGLWRPWADALDRLAEVADDGQPDAVRTLRDVVDPTLQRPVREFAWSEQEDRERVVVHADGQRWTIDEFEAEIDRVLSAVAGADAGYCIGLVSERLVDEEPSASLPAADLIAGTLCRPAGASIVAVSEDAAMITVAPIDEHIDVQRLLAATAGLVAAFPATEHFEIRRETGERLVAVAAAAVREAQESPELVRDLATVVCCHESRVARGEEPAEVTRHLAAVQTHLVVVPALSALAEPSLRPLVHRELVARLGYVSQYVREHGSRKLADRLGRARASAALAQRGDWAAHLRAVDQLTALASWAQGAGAALRWL